MNKLQNWGIGALVVAGLAYDQNHTHIVSQMIFPSDQITKADSISQEKNKEENLAAVNEVYEELFAKDCSDFSTHSEAQNWFDSHNPENDPSGLDRDGDGSACETLP